MPLSTPSDATPHTPRMLTADAASMPLDAASMPLDAASMPLDAAPMPLDAAPMPLDATGSRFYSSESHSKRPLGVRFSLSEYGQFDLLQNTVYFIVTGFPT